MNNINYDIIQMVNEYQNNISLKNLALTSRNMFENIKYKICYKLNESQIVDRIHYKIHVDKIPKKKIS